jgi:hypothetical protein
MTQFNRQMISGERLSFVADVSNRVAPVWVPNAIYHVGDLVSPTPPNATGFVYENGAEGQSGASEPTWATPAGSQTQDGSLDWTAQIPPTSEDTVQSAVWVQLNPPDGALIITDQVITDLTASAFLSGGTSGQIYTVNAVVTMVSGAIYIAQIVLQVQ